MSQPTRIVDESRRHASKLTLHAIGQAPSRGLATSIAMIRIARIARQAREDTAATPSGARR